MKKKETISLILAKAQAHPVASAWYGEDGIRLTGGYVFNSLAGLLNSLEPKCLEGILEDYDELVDGNHSHLGFLKSCADFGYLTVPVSLMCDDYDKLHLRLNYKMYLAEFRGYRYQVSSDIHGNYDYNSSNSSLQYDLSCVDDEFKPLIRLCHAAIAAGMVPEFYDLLKSKSSLLPQFVGADDSLFSYIQEGMPNTGSIAPIYIQGWDEQSSWAEVYVADDFVAVKTLEQSYHVRISGKGDTSFLVARLLLAMCGIYAHGASDFCCHDELPVISPTRYGCIVCTDNRAFEGALTNNY